MNSEGVMNLEKSSIPVQWAASILIAISGVIATAATSHYRLNVLEEEVRGQLSEMAASDRISRDHELKLQRLELSLDGMKVTLDKIDSRLERMAIKQDRK